ncbi:MAG: dipicolinate synthase subunit DpsA [Fusicatenibacter sp.]
MKKKYDILIAGGDLRLSFLARILRTHGFEVICFGTEPLGRDQTDRWEKPTETGKFEEAVASAKHYCGGIPFAKGGMLCGNAEGFPKALSWLYVHGNALKTVFGGGLPEATVEFGSQFGIRCVDFMENESFVVDNAVLTCEGAIAEALREQPFALHGAHVLVLGYGRCGKLLAEKLRTWPTRVTVCERDPVWRSYARAFGMDAVSMEELADILPEQKYVFNTIPAPVLGEEELDAVASDAVIFDLASGCGCTDREAARKKGIRIRPLPGLPGRYAPMTAAERMAEIIEPYLSVE